MDATTYQRQAMRTAKWHDDVDEQILNAVLGLAGEAGELVELVKKARYQGHAAIMTEDYQRELGDVLWYAAYLCDALAVSMSDVMKGNLAKLKGRYPEGFSAERSVNREH